MLSLSAKTVNLSALPSPSVSSQIDDPVAALALRLHLVGVVDASRRSRAGRAGPRSCMIGLPISGSAANSSASKPVGHDQVLHRLGSGASGFCILRDRLALRAPLARRAGRGGSSAGVSYVERLAGPAATRGRLSKTSPLFDGPADAALDQVVEAGVAPGPRVVAPGGVEDPPLALRADPGPRLLAGLPSARVWRTWRSFVVVLGVDVGLVPGPERLEAPS